MAKLLRKKWFIWCVVPVLILVISCTAVFGFLFLEEGKLYLYNLGVDISTDEFPNNEHIKKFIPFGAGGHPSGNPWANFEYVLDSNANVYSPCDGVVIDCFFQPDSKDWEIRIRPRTIGGIWEVSLDHVLDVQVKNGDKVKAGQIVGKPGTWLEGLGRVEIQINNNKERYFYAPFAIFDPATKNTYEAKITKLMNDLQARPYDPLIPGSYENVFDQTSMLYPGCYMLKTQFYG